MSRLAQIAVAVVIALATTTLAVETAAAGTARQRYEAAIKKVALPFASFFTGKLSKGLCVCQSDALVGVLETFPGNPPTIACTRYSFAGDGSANFAGTCNDWTPVTK